MVNSTFQSIGSIKLWGQSVIYQEVLFKLCCVPRRHEIQFKQLKIIY